jgi:acyl carrier protein
LDRAALLATTPSEWQSILEGQLREQTARVLKMPIASLDVEQPLNNLGIDSLMAIELKNRIEADLGASVPMVKFLEGPSVRDLAALLSDQLVELLPSSCDASDNRTAPSSSAHTGATYTNGSSLHDPGQLLARIETLSDAEVDSLLSDLSEAEKGD